LLPESDKGNDEVTVKTRGTSSVPGVSASTSFLTSSDRDAMSGADQISNY